MSQLTYDAFVTAARAEGFDEVIERHWSPDTTLDTHSHAYAVRALVVQGEMWLTIGDRMRHLQPGDTFELDAGMPHAERYGAEGATYWVARRHGSG